MKKIAIIYPAYYEQSTGGAELQIRYLIEFCLVNNIEVHYIYADNKKPIQNENGVYLHPMVRKKQYKFCGMGWFLYSKEIDTILTEIKPDTIYTRLGSSWINIASSYALEHNINHVHAVASDSDVNRHFRFSQLYPFFTPIENYYTNKGLKNATSIIAQNKYQQEKLLNRFHRKSLLVNQMTPIVDEASIEKNYKKIKILWIGNFKKVKRPDIFIELAKSLSKEASKVEMIMCGRIAEKHKKLIQDTNHISWLEYKGDVAQKDIFNLMSSSHILINTSEYEGFSNTFVQAWMRKMVVLSMNSNPNNIITDKKIGYITPTLEQLNRQVTYLIDNHTIIEEYGNRAYQYACEYHDLNINMNKIISIL